MEIATVDLDSNGVATFSTSAMTGGTHTIMATYLSACCTFETGCFASSNAALTHTINTVSPQLGLGATPAPGTYGNSVRLNATIGAYQYGTPTGSVSFYLGSTFLGTSPITEGVANWLVNGLNAGFALINARYNGDTNFLATNFPSFLETINKANVTVSLTNFEGNPTQYGEEVIINASVNSTSTIPTGTVSFFRGATLLSTMALNSGGSAALQISTLAIGSNSITAVYNGDSNFNTATSPATVLTVNKSNSVTTVTSISPNPSTYNSPATISVSVAGATPGASVPTGTVTGYLGGISLGTATLSGGVVTFVTSVLPAGTNTVSVNYSGDGNFFSSIGLGSQTVNLAATTISTPTSSSAPSVFGQSVTFSATVSSPAGIPTGMVSFYDGTTQLGVATLNSSGTAALSTAALTVATHPITAVYGGSTSFATATSSTFSQVVNRASTTTVITSNIATSVYGQAVTFTATVAPVFPGAGNPTGTVTFRNGAVTLGTVSLSSGGTASFTTTSLAASGTPYSITAVYAVSTSFATSTSSAINQTVNPVATVLSAASSLNPSILGQSITFSVTVNAVNTGTVIPIGTVTATYGSTVIGTGSLNASGQITFTTSSLPAGTLPIIFTYAGNTNFAASSTSLDQTIQPAATTITLTSSLTPSYIGQNIVLTATTATASGVSTGTVSFFDGNTLIGTQTLNGSGVATLSISTLSLGIHTLRAVYNGDSSHGTSTSTVISQVVQQATTSTTVSSSVNPSAFNQATIFTATVAVTNGAGSPTGTVSFFNNGVLIGTRGLSGNLSTLSLSNLAPGSYTITAVYNGDVNFATSTSPGITQVVTTTPTATSMVSSLNPANLGVSITLTATVQPTITTGNPTGSVTFRDGSTVLGTVALSGSQAALNISSLLLGSHTLNATYNGDSNFGISVSSNVTQVINQGSTTTALTSNTNPSVFAEAITFTAMVTPGNPSIPATGNVTFFDGSTSLGTVALSGGTATFTTSSLSVASHSMTAVYAGNSNYTTSTSPAYLQVVSPASTVTTVTPSANPVVYGSSVTFTSVVTPQSGTGVPTGLVSFREGTSILGSVPLVGGTATFTTSALTSGGHSISAIYLGTSNFLTSTSTSFTQVIESGTTTTTLSSSTNPATFGQQVTLTANIAIATGSGVASGTVSFFDGSNVIGTAVVSSGVATLSTSSMSVGSHTLTASYSGNDNFGSSTSAALTQTITKASSVTNILSATPNPSMFGQNVTFFATVSTTSVDPTGTVSFYNGPDLLGTVPIFHGIAIYDTNILSLGVHSITAVYSGDVNFSTSTSGPEFQTVNQTSVTLTTAVSLTSSLNPSTYGELVEFDVQVVPITGTGVPTGVVTLYSGAVTLVTLPLVNGMATYSSSNLVAGTWAIVALYSGDSVYSASTTTITQTINQVATTTSLASSAISSTVFSPVTFTATVTSPLVGVSGIVSFYDEFTLLGISQLNGIGQATFTTEDLTVGSHNITAVFSGSQNFAVSADTVVQTITQAPTSSVVLSSSANPSQFGNQVTFVSVVSSTKGIPTGTVDFYDGSTLLGSSPLHNGFGAVRTATLSPGPHVITVVYSGSTNYSPSTSISYTQVVNAPLAVTSTAITSSQNPTYAGESSIISVAVTSSTAGTPTGSVAIYDGSTLIGTQLLSGGAAQYTFNSTALGTHSLTAVYSGDSVFATSTSPPLAQVVQVATTATTLTSSVNPSRYGQTTLLTASVAVTNGSGNLTGSVSFYDASTLIGTVSLSNGVAVLPVSQLSSGTHSLTAVYSGDSIFNGSTSTAVSQLVNTATTTTSVSSSLNPAELGQQVTFTALANAPADAGSITGTVSFYDGATLIGTSSLVGTTASISTSALTTGTHTITATYNGSSNLLTSTSFGLAQTISLVSSSVSMSSNIDPSQYGQSITLEAAVYVGGGSATGSVTFYDGPQIIGSSTLSGNIATLAISTLSVDAHSLSAVYSGDSSNAASASPLYIQYVTAVDTTTTVTSSVNPTVFGNSTVLTATVQPQVGTAIANGLVSFREGSKILGSVQLSGGVASLTVSDLQPGSHSISAIYLGNTNFVTSTSTVITQTVQPGTTSTALTSQPNPSLYGTEVLLSATLSVVSGTGVPTGSITFMDGSTVLGTSCLCGGVATLSTKDLTLGTHPLTAIYSGDDSFSGSVSNLVNQTVNQDVASITILSAAPNPSMLGQNVVFFASIAGSQGSPTGTVSFYDGSLLLGTVPMYSGISIYETALLAVGNHTITAHYNGDVNYLPATSPAVIQTVNQTQITVTTVTNLTSSLNPSNFGDSVTLDVSVVPIAGPGMPTGVVTIYSGSIPLITLQLVNGMASYTTSDLPAGVLTLVALYSGDSAFSSSTDTLSQTVLAIATTTAVTSSSPVATIYQPVTFTATVASGTGIPGGTVSFYDGSTLLGTSGLNGSGTASLTTSNLAIGSHTIQAVYNGSSNYQSSSSSLTQVIGTAQTVTSIILASPNPSDVNENVSIIASVSALDGIPSGVVNFYDGGALIGSSNLVNGLATLSTSFATPGAHNITAVYSGSQNFATSTSSIYVQQVNQPLQKPRISLSTSKSRAEYGEQVVFTATVKGRNGTPTGSVMFFDGSVSLGTALLVNGKAELSTSTLSIGTHLITAIYSGDGTYTTLTSRQKTVVIVLSTVPPPPQNFYGCQYIDKYVNVDRIVNVLTWSPPQTLIEVVKYEIYRDAALTELVGVAGNQCPHRFEDGRGWRNRISVYYIVAVSIDGVRSPPAIAKVIAKNRAASGFQSVERFFDYK